MAIGNLLSVAPKQISASSLVKTGDGVVAGIFVSAASATPTITVYDGLTSGGTKIVDTFTPTAGTFYRFDYGFAIGLYVALSGTVSCTVGYV